MMAHMTVSLVAVDGASLKVAHQKDSGFQPRCTMDDICLFLNKSGSGVTLEIEGVDDPDKATLVEVQDGETDDESGTDEGL